LLLVPAVLLLSAVTRRLRRVVAIAVAIATLTCGAVGLVAAGV
jgi:hypothetical protein